MKAEALRVPCIRRATYVLRRGTARMHRLDTKMLPSALRLWSLSRGNNLENRDILAKQAFEYWAAWMGYLISCCDINIDGTATIPAKKVRAWKEAMSKSYEQLSEIEKNLLRETDATFFTEGDD